MLYENIGKSAMLEQTAEECSELAQACLKLSRKYRGENYTPRTQEEIESHLLEEIADVMICIDELSPLITNINNNAACDGLTLEDWIKYKTNRISDRLNISEKQ